MMPNLPFQGIFQVGAPSIFPLRAIFPRYLRTRKAFWVWIRREAML